MLRRVVALLAVAALSACGDGPGGPLFDGGWVLGEVVVDGQPVAVAQPSSNRWSFLSSGGCEDGDPVCPDGAKLRGADLCNFFTRSISVEGDRVIWGTYGVTTAAACEPIGGDPIGEFYRQDSFTYVVDADVLRATSADGRIELVFSAGT